VADDRVERPFPNPQQDATGASPAARVHRAGLRIFLDLLAAAPRRQTGLGELVGAAVPASARQPGSGHGGAQSDRGVTGRRGVFEIVRGSVAWRGRLGWLALAALGPLVLFAVALATARLLEGSWPDLSRFGATTEYPALPLVVFWAANLLFYGYGEEIGWRGFAQPELQRRRSALRAAVIVSVIWAGWHLPLFGTRGSRNGSKSTGEVRADVAHDKLVVGGFAEVGAVVPAGSPRKQYRLAAIKPITTARTCTVPEITSLRRAFAPPGAPNSSPGSHRLGPNGPTE